MLYFNALGVLTVVNSCMLVNLNLSMAITKAR